MYLSLEKIKNGLLKILCENSEGLKSDEILERLDSMYGTRVNRFLFRRLLGELVRFGIIERRPCHGRRGHLFTIKDRQYCISEKGS